MIRRLLAGLLAPALALALPAALAAAPRPCRVDGLANEVLCGAVERALDPARPDGVRIAVHYVVVPALARGKRSDPVVLLAGGPGQSAIDLAPALMGVFARLNQRRDIVFVDQRGTGRSAPLACEDGHDALPLSESGDIDVQLRRLAECRTRLAALPHVREAANLAFFTTTLAMQDLDAVRSALGAQRLNLVGVSYGTRAALEYQRRFPQAVRRSVLDGVAPPDMVLPASAGPDAQAALDALLAACAAEPACASAHATLRSDWQALLDSLPHAVDIADPRDGRPRTLTVTREMLLAAVRAPLYLPALAAALPAAIAAAAQGRFEPLAALAANVAPRRGQRIATGMHFAVVCSEDLPRLATADGATARDFGAGLVPLYRRACAGWPRASVPDAFYRVAAAATPVLLFSGGLDPATPPRHGERVARSLGALARHVVVPNAGHGVLATGCVPELLQRFVEASADAALAIDASCIRGIPRPPAFLPPGPEAPR